MNAFRRTWLSVAGRKVSAPKLARYLWRQWGLPLFVAIIVVVPVKSSLADWNWVPTGSMNPTILPGDLIFVNKLAYDLRFPLTLHRLAEWSSPQRGDIVVCLSPADGMRLVKRIVATPGDILEMRDNVLLLNNQPLIYRTPEQDFVTRLPADIADHCICAMEELDETPHPVLAIPTVYAKRNFGPVTIPQDQYFVMGDNRDLSKDSRYFGCVGRRAILGRVQGVVGSFDITDKYQPRFNRFFTGLR